jgi:uncharacterized protein YbaR (Trm112 family)
MIFELDPALLEILACPQCHSNVSIDYEAEEVVCVGVTCGLAFPIRDDIPIMLVEAARPMASPTRPNSPAEAASSSSTASPGSPAAKAGRSSAMSSGSPVARAFRSSAASPGSPPAKAGPSSAPRFSPTSPR